MSTETSRGGVTRGSLGGAIMPTARVTFEDGTVGNVLPVPIPLYTFAEAMAEVDATVDPTLQTAKRGKLSEAANHHGPRIMANATEAGAAVALSVASRHSATQAHLRAAQDLIDALNGGRTTVAEAVREFDRIVNEQAVIGRQLDGLRARADRAVKQYRQPLTAYDEMIRRFPALRDGRPLLSF